MSQSAPSIPDDTPIDLVNPQRWQLRYTNTFIAPSEGGEVFSAIPEQSIAIPFTSPILAIQTIAQNDPWARYLGSLTQVQTIGINASARLAYRSIYRGTQLTRFNQDIIGTYGLLFKPNRRIERVSITVYEYLP